MKQMTHVSNHDGRFLGYYTTGGSNYLKLGQKQCSNHLWDIKSTSWCSIQLHYGNYSVLQTASKS